MERREILGRGLLQEHGGRPLHKLRQALVGLQIYEGNDDRRGQDILSFRRLRNRPHPLPQLLLL